MGIEVYLYENEFYLKLPLLKVSNFTGKNIFFPGVLPEKSFDKQTAKDNKTFLEFFIYK